MIAALVLVQALAAAAPIAPIPALEDPARLGACVRAIDVDADAAYETARIWIAEAGRPDAFVCAALADIGRGRPEAGARQFEALAREGPEGARASFWAQAGNAWLLAEAPQNAVAALTQASRLAPEDPDIRIDRARAYAALGQWSKAEADLTLAIDARPQDSLAYRLRAESRLRQRVLHLAARDAERAVELAPDDVENRWMLGRVREAEAAAAAGG